MNRIKSEHRRFAAAATAAALWLFLLSARAVTLQWDANSETNVAGYRVYMGRQPRVYDSVLDVGNQTLAQLSTIGRTTYFAVTAYNTAGLESDFSGEVSFTTNSAPTAQTDQYNTTQNTTLTVAATGGILLNDSDADGDLLSVLPVSSVIHGTLSLNLNGSFSYTPASNFTGTDSFSYRATDGQATSMVVLVTLTVNSSPNSAPTVQPDHYATIRNVPLTASTAGGVLVNDSDVDGDALVALLVASASHGTLSLNGSGSFSYTPASNFTGIDFFSYRVTDGRATSAVALVTIVVNTPPNSAPHAQPNQYVTTKNVPLNVSAGGGILANDSDADGETLVALLVSSTSHGTLSLNPNGSFSYTPALNFTGTDSFSYRATDSFATSAVASVTLTVSNTNSVPTAEQDQYVTSTNTLLHLIASEGVLANDSDADGNTLAALLVSPATHGSLSLNADGSFDYTPALNFAGMDSFSYCATDGSATSAVVTVMLVVDQNAANSSNCLDCFAALDAVLMVRSNVFPGVMAARLNVPTNVTCPQSSVLLFGTLCRSLKGIEDSEIRNALSAAGDCLAAILQREATLRLAIASDLSASKWTTAASNQVAGARRILERARATTNETIRGQLLTSASSSLLRTDRLITAGDLAPTTLTNNSLVCRILGQRNPPLVTFTFGAESFVIADATNGTPLAVGTYAYARTAWNRGSLVLVFDSDILGHAAGEIVTLKIKFSRVRHRITGSLRGYFSFE